MPRGIKVFAPICHTHPIAQYGLPKDWEFWQEYDRAFLDRCDGIVVAMMPGYVQSKGVGAEMRHMMQAGKPVLHLDIFFGTLFDEEGCIVTTVPVTWRPVASHGPAVSHIVASEGK